MRPRHRRRLCRCEQGVTVLPAYSDGEGAPHMSTSTEDRRDYRFTLGLLAGACVGAGVVLWLAPRAASEIRGRARDAAKDLAERASDGYDQASVRVGAVAD